MSSTNSDRPTLIDSTYEELILGSVASLEFQTFFKVRELADVLGVDVNTKEPPPEGHSSPWQLEGGWRSRTIREMWDDIDKKLKEPL